MTRIQKVIDQLREHVLPLTWDQHLRKFPTVVAIEIREATQVERAILAKWLKLNLPTGSFLNVKGNKLDVGSWFPFIESDATHVVAEWHPYGEDWEHVHLVGTGMSAQHTLYDFFRVGSDMAPLVNKDAVSALERLVFIATESIYS